MSKFKVTEFRADRQGDVAMIKFEGDVSGLFESLKDLETTNLNGTPHKIIERGEGAHHYHVVNPKVPVKEGKLKANVFKKAGLPGILTRALVISTPTDTELKQISTQDPSKEIEALHNDVPIPAGNWLVFPRQLEFINDQPRPVVD